MLDCEYVNVTNNDSFLHVFSDWLPENCEVLLCVMSFQSKNVLKILVRFETQLKQSMSLTLGTLLTDGTVLTDGTILTDGIILADGISTAVYSLKYCRNRKLIEAVHESITDN